MVKRIICLLMVVGLLGGSATFSFAVVKGLQSQQDSIAKVGKVLIVPLNAEVKDAVSVGGPVIVLGRVEKDVVSVGSSVYVRDSAVIGGDVVSIGGRVFRSPKAIIGGDTVEINVKQFVPAAAYVSRGKILSGLAVVTLLNFLALLIVAALLVAFFTSQLGKISAKIEAGVVRSFLWGLLFLLLVLPAAILLVLTLIGILLLPLFVVVVAAALFVGHIAAAHLVGKKLLALIKQYNKSMMTETLTGVAALWLIGLVPFVGGLVNAFFVCCGFGAVTLTRFGTNK